MNKICLKKFKSRLTSYIILDFLQFFSLTHKISAYTLLLLNIKSLVFSIFYSFSLIFFLWTIRPCYVVCIYEYSRYVPIELCHAFCIICNFILVRTLSFF